MDVRKLTPLCLLLLFPLASGLFGLLPELQLSSTEIKIYERERKTWAEAQAFCRRHHVDMFRVTSSLDKRKILSVRGWVGLYRDDEQSEWKWSGREELPADLDYTIMHKGGNCIYTSKYEDIFKTSNCSEKRSLTCFEEKMVLVRENKTWEEALEHCRALRGGDSQGPGIQLYDLVTVFDDDLEFAQQTAEEATTDEVWIGLRFLAGHWWWVSGEPTKYSCLQSCPADRACGVLEKNHSAAFETRSCMERRNFLCGKRTQTIDGKFGILTTG